jgi:hypothetical protein
MKATSPPRAHRDTRASPRITARLLALAGLVALLGGLAAVVMASGSSDAGESAAPPVTAATPKPKPPPPRPAAVKIAVTGVGAFDPEGDQSENGGDAPLATDGNPATAWKSERYRSTFTKSGVGLVVDAGRPVKASRVVLTTDTPGYDAEIRVGSSPTGPFVAVSKNKATGTRTIFALKPRSGRYLMVWITSMAPDGAAAVNEIAVTAGG